ncbi:MAG: hypothetical protein ACFB51_17680 [Anaerolineae bacterium]
MESNGPNGYLLALGIVYTLIFFVAAGQSLVVDRVNRAVLMGWVIFAFALVFLMLRIGFFIPNSDTVLYTLVYIVSELQWVIFPLIFWILINDVYSPAQARRLIPLTATLGITGKLVGIGITWVSPRVVEAIQLATEDIILINVLIYLIAFVVAQIRLSNVDIRETNIKTEGLKETLTDGWGFIKEVPAFRFLTISIILLTVCDTVIEFHFYTITSQFYPTAAEYTAFFSIYRLVGTGFALITQGVLTARIIETLELKRTFYFLPVVTVIATVWMLATPVNMAGLVAAVGGIGLLKLIRDNTDESARKSFQTLVPEERRGRVSTFIDTYLLSAGTVLGAIITALIVLVGSLVAFAQTYYVYLGLALVMGGIAIWAIVRMNETYDASMLNWRLKRRQRRSRAIAALLDQAFGPDS